MSKDLTLPRINLKGYDPREPSQNYEKIMLHNHSTEDIFIAIFIKSETYIIMIICHTIRAHFGGSN